MVQDNNRSLSSTKLDILRQRKEKVGSLGAIDFLIEREEALQKGSLSDFIRRRSSQYYVSNDVNEADYFTMYEKSRDESTYFQCYREFVQDAEIAELRQKIKYSEDLLSSLRWQHEQHAPHPLVSVIMPTYNRASVIGRSIATVLEQSYLNFELIICDDGSEDNTYEVIDQLDDKRVRYLKLENGGAAAARNAGLAAANGVIIAYLDSDNYWHPDYLLAMVTSLRNASGHSAIYCDFLDFQINAQGGVTVRSFDRPSFSHESLLKKPFIDLNSFVHFRELYDCYGGFNSALKRRQDYDLMIKYTWMRDPLHLKCLLTLYQRNEGLEQITSTQKSDQTCITIVQNAVDTYFKSGLPARRASWPRKVTILSWDMSRNHFSKPFAIAEALSKEYDVQLVSFRFFNEPIFPPLEGVKPSFETLYIQGDQFPNFFNKMEQALSQIKGDIIYVVKPRLPSLGLALLANKRFGTPIALEINDLETVIGEPGELDRHVEFDLANVEFGNKELLNPYSDLWSQLMDPISKKLPTLVTHNKGLDEHFDKRCLYMRNIKDESIYDPSLYDRMKIRAELGYAPSDRVILFGGLLRKHKGIYELIELLERLGDQRYKLLFVGSRVTPDQKKLDAKYGHVVKVLPPQDRESMARINLAADLVILWLNPDVPASHYQFPYKATDAFAMGTPVIANDISDLGDLARQGYLREVPFGDWDGMTTAVQGIFSNQDETESLRAAARRLYLRQFSYAAVRNNFALIAYRAVQSSGRVLPVAEEFTRYYEAFERHLSGGVNSRVSITRNKRSGLKIILKNPTPNAESKHWGDYHFGRCLTKYLTRLGANVQTHYHKDWERRADEEADVVIVLRGKFPYKPRGNALHLMWNISHPDMLTASECDQYDAVYVASSTHAARLGRYCSKPVLPLLQCTDLEEFEVKSKEVRERKGAIFVGNSRGVTRPCVDWAVEAGLDFSIYGRDWDRFGHKDRVVATYVANEDLPSLYQQTSFTLNDHWLDMRQMGYVNNRVFDCLAAGLPIISDDFPELRAICGDNILYYHDEASFREALRVMNSQYADVVSRQHVLWQGIRESFSFEARANTLMNMILTLKNMTPMG